MSYGSIDDTLRYLVVRNSNDTGVKPSARKTDDADAIGRILTEKVTCLGTIIADIGKEIDKRTTLSAGVIDRIYQHYFYVSSKLLELTQWPLSGNRAIEQRRSQLETMLDTLLNEKRREQILCLQDVAKLKRDFWRWFKEYCDVVQRMSVVTGRSDIKQSTFRNSISG